MEKVAGRSARYSVELQPDPAWAETHASMQPALDRVHRLFQAPTTIADRLQQE